MPLPKHPFTIRGGCNCRAIRYKISVPPFEERPKSVYCTPGADVGEARFPAVYLDHRNDCRSATSSILPMAVVCETRTVQASLLPHEAGNEGRFETPDSEREWSAASEIFDFRSPELKDSFLSVYKSSDGRSRWFCGRCGTMIAYSIDPGFIPAEWGWPPMIDFWLGTVDREDLEKDYMAAERKLWCEKGVPWIRKLSQVGAGDIPEHPLTKIDKLVGDDIEEDLKELAGLDRWGKEPLA